MPEEIICVYMVGSNYHIRHQYPHDTIEKIITKEELLRLIDFVFYKQEESREEEENGKIS